MFFILVCLSVANLFRFRAFSGVLGPSWFLHFQNEKLSGQMKALISGGPFCHPGTEERKCISSSQRASCKVFAEFWVSKRNLQGASGAENCIKTLLLSFQQGMQFSLWNEKDIPMRISVITTLIFKGWPVLSSKDKCQFFPHLQLPFSCQGLQHSVKPCIVFFRVYAKVSRFGKGLIGSAFLAARVIGHVPENTYDACRTTIRLFMED